MIEDDRQHASWFDDQDLLISELRQGTFAPRRAPALTGFDDLHEIGRGGQAVVFVGLQRSTHRRAAIKVLLDGVLASDISRRRFEREIELVASLRHPNIVGIYDSGCSPEGHAYCVMEYIDGVPLDEYAKRFDLFKKRDDLRRFLDLFAGICDAVNFAHQHGVIHRDLKPSNIRVDKDGQPRILDFGLAKLSLQSADKESGTGVSVTGQFVGSLAWASPEQARGEPDHIDIRSDVYSLGVMLYSTLTGRFPYEVSGSLHAVLGQILSSEPYRPRLANRLIHEDLETILLRCLAKEPQRRYQTAGELAADLRRCLAGEPILARSNSAWYTIRKNFRRYRTAAIVTGVVFASTIVLSVVMTILYGRAARAEATARQEAARAAAVNTFLGDMLASADPGVKSRDVTVRAVLDEAGRRLDANLSQEPAVRASLHGIMATTFRGLSEYAKSRSHWEAAISLFRGQYGENDRNTIEAERELGETLIEENKFDDAEKRIAASREKAAAHFPPDDIANLRADGSLARLRSHQGRSQEAELIFKPLVERMTRSLGADHKETLATINNLAAVYHAQGKYAEAETMYRRVLAAQVARYGKDSTAALTSMTNVAVVLNTIGKFPEAESLLREEVAAALRVWGPEHRTTLISQMDLVFNLRQQGRLNDALKIALEVLPIQKRVLGPEHSDTIETTISLATIYDGLQRFDDSLPLAREAYETSLRVYGEKSEHTLNAMHNYGSILTRAGRTVEAESVIAKNLELYRKFYRPDHPDLAWPMNELASLWVAQGKFNQAADLFADAIRLVRNGLPPDHYFLPWLLGNRGACLRDAKRYEEAEKDLLESYELYRKKAGDKNSDTQWAIHGLIKLYRLWPKPAEAERFKSLLYPPPSTQHAASSQPAASSSTADR